MRTTIAVLNKKGCDARQALVPALEQLGQGDCHFTLASPIRILEADDARVLREASLGSPVLIGCVSPGNLDGDNSQIAQIGNAVSLFEGRLYSDSHGALHALMQQQEKNIACERIMRNLLTETEGDFSLIIAEPQKLLATRDPMGVQPLYYGESEDLAAVASNRLALWTLGISRPYSFPPGNVASASHKGFEFIPVKTLYCPELRSVTISDATGTMQQLLEHSIRVRLRGLGSVAVAFSGGLDSSLIAFLAKKCPVNVQLVHVSLRGQAETEEAKKAADELKLPLSVYLHEAEEVEKTLPEVVRLIEEPDPVKTAVGVPFYWIAKKAAESGFRILLAGQGADELFGGYRRYVDEYLSYGKEKVREIMFQDVLWLHKSNIERDEKISRFHGVELRLPFASYEIAEFALSLPLELKLEKKADGLRKLLLRRIALNLGLPDDIVCKPKKALQYGTGVSAILGKIAKKHSMTFAEYVERLFRQQRNTGKENTDAKSGSREQCGI